MDDSKYKSRYYDTLYNDLVPIEYRTAPTKMNIDWCQLESRLGMKYMELGHKICENSICNVRCNLERKN